jgi:molecular chaperone GrpE
MPPTDPAGPTGGPDADVTDQAAADQAAARSVSDAGGAPATDPVTDAGDDAAPATTTRGTTPTTDAEADADTPIVEEDVDELATVTRQRDDYLDALRHMQADFENYKKRVAKQQADLGERATQGLVDRLLPVLDTADLALAHGAGEGVKQIWDALSEALEKEGLERIDVAGAPFDPNLHDAVAHEPGDGAQEVAEVMRAGYRWKGRVIRPAMVKVRG